MTINIHSPLFPLIVGIAILFICVVILSIVFETWWVLFAILALIGVVLFCVGMANLENI